MSTFCVKVQRGMCIGTYDDLECSDAIFRANTTMFYNSWIPYFDADTVKK